MRQKWLSRIFFPLFIYCISYVVLMEANKKSMNERSEITFNSTFRFQKFSPYVDPKLGVTRDYGSQTLWNWIFYPMELLVKRLEIFAEYRDL